MRHTVHSWLGSVEGRTGEAEWAQDGVSYAISRKDGMGDWGFQGEESKSQDDKAEA